MGGGRVLEGDYKRKNVYYLFGKVYIQASIKSRIYIDSETVENYEMLDNGTRRITATMNRLKNDSNILVDIRFKNGKKSLIRCDKILYQAIIKKCY